MKNKITKIGFAICFAFSCVFATDVVLAQVPDAVNFQAIARDGDGEILANTPIQLRLTIIDGAADGTEIYQELRALTTNNYGSFSFQIGRNANYVTIGSFEEIDWAVDNKFLKIDYDPTNTFSFDLSLGTIEFVTVPYAFAAGDVTYIDLTGVQDGDILVYNESSGKFEPTQPNATSLDWNLIQNKPDFAPVATSGNYNDLINVPVNATTSTAGLMSASDKSKLNGIAAGAEVNVNADWNATSGDAVILNKPNIPQASDGSETVILPGNNISITGSGTSLNPYVVNAGGTKLYITSNQTWTVPAGVSKIKVELWGGSGGGGGAGLYSYSYINGGYGGNGGYIQQEINVTPGQQFGITIGIGGMSGSNATSYSYGYSIGDTDGNNGGDSWFGSYKAAGGSGGKRGSYASFTTNGSPGSANIGTITAYSDNPILNILNVFTGLPRSYINENVMAAKAGKGGYYLNSYSYPATSGEAGCAVITIF